MRKNIFEIASQSIDMPSAVNRLLKMFQSEKLLCEEGLALYNLLEYVDTYCFGKWKQRSHFIDANDFLNAIDFDILKVKAKTDVESFLTLIELIYNFWYLSKMRLSRYSHCSSYCYNYYHLKNVMDDILTQYNHVAYYSENDERVLVIEDKPEVTAVAEMVPKDLAKEIIKYNHRELKGRFEVKKQILISLGAELEPKRKELKRLDEKLENSIFFMLNNLNIRHNNCRHEDKAKYKEYIANLTPEELEELYDDLYQMILLAFLQMDNVDRLAKVKKLKEKLTENQGNR